MRGKVLDHHCTLKKRGDKRDKDSKRSRMPSPRHAQKGHPERKNAHYTWSLKRKQIAEKRKEKKKPNRIRFLKSSRPHAQTNSQKTVKRSKKGQTGNEKSITVKKEQNLQAGKEGDREPQGEHFVAFTKTVPLPTTATKKNFGRNESGDHLTNAKSKGVLKENPKGTQSTSERRL